VAHARSARRAFVTAGLCLFVAGQLLATLPGAEFTLAWTHSVAKSRWEERYRIEGAWLVLERARVEGSGAGMEPGFGAIRHDGSWRWTPAIAPLRELRLTASSLTSDYELCSEHGCRPLQALTGKLADGTVVVAAPCAESRPR
jgi:hypothetical protein